MAAIQDVGGRLVVSFDIGVKNLAVAVVAVGAEGAVVAHMAAWRVVSLAEAGRKAMPRPEVLCERLFAHLDALWEELLQHGAPATVLIENQPSKGVMKTMQSWIQSYFMLRKRWSAAPVDAVLLVSAVHKLRGHDHTAPELLPLPAGAPRSAAYAYNKKLGVALARRYIAEDAELQALFEGQAKRDDLADALLQALAWLRARRTPVQRVFMAPQHDDGVMNPETVRAPASLCAV
jgi:hypothetical protein